MGGACTEIDYFPNATGTYTHESENIDFDVIGCAHYFLSSIVAE